MGSDGYKAGAKGSRTSWMKAMALGEKAIDKGPMPRLGWECRSTARAWELASIHSGGERIEWAQIHTRGNEDIRREQSQFLQIIWNCGGCWSYSALALALARYDDCCSRTSGLRYVTIRTLQ